MWGVPGMGIPQNGWCIMENPIMDEFEVSYFWTPLSMYQWISFWENLQENPISWENRWFPVKIFAF